MPEEHLEFGPSVHGLFVDTFGGSLTPEVRAAMRAAGIDIDKPLNPAYPAHQYIACVKLAARGMAPELSEEEALKAMAARAVQGLSTNFLGRALLTALRAWGLRRALLHAERAFRNSNNYTRIDAQQLGPTSVELTFNTVMGIPSYIEGVLMASTALLGGREPRLDSTPLDGEKHRFVLHWKE